MSDDETILKIEWKDAEFGDLVCQWAIDAALAAFKKVAIEYLGITIEKAGITGATGMPTQDELEEEAQRMVAEYKALLFSLAPNYFLETKGRLNVDAALRVIRDYKVSIRSPGEGAGTAASWGEMRGRDLAKEINEVRDMLSSPWQVIFREPFSIKPGRPDDPLPEDVAVYYKEVLAKVKKAKADISSYGLDMELFRKEEVFADLNKHPDLMERLFKMGRESQPACIAREYTIRQFRLNMSEGALEKALQRKGKKTK